MFKRSPHLTNVAAACGSTETQGKRRNSIPMREFLSWDIPEEEPLLGTVMTRASTGLLSAPRGLGKSLLAMNIGYSVACGKRLLPWGVGAGVVVVYLDGEMHSRTFQKRLRQIRNRDTNEKTAAIAMRNLHIISRDSFGEVIGYIDNEQDQLRIEQLLPEDTALLIVDNLSAWTSSSREDGSSFAPIKRWMARLRAKGIAVLLVHHTGKSGGDQRGSSVHEDMLDYSILLSEEKGTSKPKNGTSFLLKHTKLRELHPDLPQTCRFVFTTEEDVMHLAYADCENALSEIDTKIAKRLEQGIQGKAIADELGVQTSKVSRVKTRLAAKQQATSQDVKTASEANDET